MAKTLNLSSLRVREVVIRPQEDVPLAVLYEILDDAGTPAMHKSITVKKEDMPAAALTALIALVDKITTRLTTLEGL